MKIEAVFPGGNIIVRGIDGHRATLSTDLRDTDGYWFYWCMEVEFASPGEYCFEFDNIAIGARGPALSEDGGITWRWLGFSGCTENSFVYHASRPGRIRFGMSMQYRQSHLERFLAAFPGVVRSTFCRSNGGRDVELLRVGAANPEYKILLTSRHHCCEMTATYVLEGILRAAIADPEWLQRVALYAVPFVDKDGVEQGDQGKNRRPHDHARDYGRNDSIYAETKEITAFLAAEHPDVVLDLHCPWIRGGGNERLHFVGPEQKRMERAMDEWGALLKRELPPEIPYWPEDNIRFGTGWNTSANYTKGQTLAKYAATREDIRAALSMEIPYANAGDVTLNVAQYLEIGAALKRVVAAWLEPGA